MLYTGLINNGRYVVYNRNGEPVCNNSFTDFEDVVEYAFGNNDVNVVVQLNVGDLENLRNGREISLSGRIVRFRAR